MTQAKPVHISLPTGDYLEAVVSYPDNDEPSPGLIVAPGSGYSKDGLLIVELCEQATATGFITLRFDWRYTTSGGGPSSNRKREIEDLQNALGYLELLDGINAHQLVLAGKSLGAGVAFNVFGSRPDVLAAMLLTPVFRNPDSGSKNYPGLPHEQRPVYMLTGKSDPLNKLDIMQHYLGDANPRVLVHVVDGNHGLELSRAKSPEAVSVNQENIRSAVSHAVDWLKTTVA